MQPFRLGRWGTHFLPQGARHCVCRSFARPHYSPRFQSTIVANQVDSVAVPAAPKRKRGRPRKEATLAEPLTANASSISRIADAVSAPASIPRQPAETILEQDVAPVDLSSQAREDIEPVDHAPLGSEPAGSQPRATTFSSESRERDAAPNSESRLELSPTLPDFPAQLGGSDAPSGHPVWGGEYTLKQLGQMPSPPPSLAKRSAKLAALHARLKLPQRLPLPVLAKCLVHPSADPDSRFNNKALASIGSDFLVFHMTEHLITHYPRLPMVVLEAAIQSYIGHKALLPLAQGWGIEFAAEPGGEVDPGMLQFRRTEPSRVHPELIASLRLHQAERAGTELPYLVPPYIAAGEAVRAVFGAVYTYAGAAEVKQMFAAHILSRYLNLDSLFTFTQPLRDLSVLCAREGFARPTARLISETGRHSRSPVYVVGVFSGRDKLGEDVGASLIEARFKAAVRALKGWYLYSPQTVAGTPQVPSDARRGEAYNAPHVDHGEVIV